MIFVDSNVPMYLVGSPHPNRDRLESFLRSHASEVFVTSAEVYQEIVHRYVAIDRRGAIADCFALLDQLVEQAYPVTRADVDAAHAIAMGQRVLSGRDCLHLAVMERHGVRRVLTCDRGFAVRPGITCSPDA